MRFFLSAMALLLCSLQSFSQTEIYNIGFLVDKINPDLDEMLDILQEEILAVVGEDAEVRFSKNNRLTNNFSPELAQQQYDKLLANETDIIIAFGSINNEILANQKTYGKPTILFGSISENLIDKPPFNSSVKIENFTSIATVVSYEEDLKVLKEITSAKSVGVFIESSFLKTAGIKGEFDGFEDNLYLELDVISFDSLDDMFESWE